MRSRLVSVTRLRVARPSTTRNPRSKLPPWNRAPRRLAARRFQIAAMSCSRKRIMDSIVRGGLTLLVTKRENPGGREAGLLRNCEGKGANPNGHCTDQDCTEQEEPVLQEGCCSSPVIGL